MKNKIIVELNEIYQLGMKKKAFKVEGIIVIDDMWHCVHKPTDDKLKSVILWAWDNPHDTVLTEEKIVSLFVF
jgi:hypothetical protein